MYQYYILTLYYDYTIIIPKTVPQLSEGARLPHKQPSETGSRRRRLNIEIVQVILRATWKTESDEENRIISMNSW